MLNKEEFCVELETLYAENLKISRGDVTLIETLVGLCVTYDIDYLFVKPLLNKSIIEKLEVEAMKMNMLKHKKSTVSLDAFI